MERTGQILCDDNKLELEAGIRYGEAGEAGKQMENRQIMQAASKSLYFVSNWKATVDGWEIWGCGCILPYVFFFPAVKNFLKIYPVSQENKAKNMYIFFST